MSELRECPFCASTQLAAKDDPNQGYKWGAITCLSCSATGPEVRTGYDKPEKWRPQAIEEWNHRASPSSGVDVDEIRSAFGEGCRAGWSMCAARVDIFNGPDEILRAWDISVSKARAISASSQAGARDEGGGGA